MPKHHNLPKLLVSVDEAAEMLSIGRTRLYELMNDGTLPYVHVGASRRLRTTDLEAFAAGLQAAA
jgi:excisionase family DNA binding protein